MSSGGAYDGGARLSDSKCDSCERRACATTRLCAVIAARSMSAKVESAPLCAGGVRGVGGRDAADEVSTSDAAGSSAIAASATASASASVSVISTSAASSTASSTAASTAAWTEDSPAAASATASASSASASSAAAVDRARARARGVGGRVVPRPLALTRQRAVSDPVARLPAVVADVALGRHLAAASRTASRAASRAASRLPADGRPSAPTASRRRRPCGLGLPLLG
mmetsp:Transcript_14355/g.46356  ORF Transcript_14355/g.46356 Transcript_14355/m.46356 type:complete len:228 (-) Transcript_14355:153-836(-)